MITDERLAELEFLEVSPAGFNVYYDSVNDICIKIKSNKTVTYSERIEGFTGKHPYNFNKSDYYQ